MFWFNNLPAIEKIGYATFFLIILGILGLVFYLGVRQILELRHFQDLALKDRIDLKLEITKTAAQILGGAFFLLTIYITWQNLIVTQEKTRAELVKNQSDLTLAQEKQITELYVKAIEQLGRQEMAERLGGIYALERLARGSWKEKWPILEVLTAYVREKSTRLTPMPSAAIPSQSGQKRQFSPDPTANPQPAKAGGIWPRTDIQAILTVIGGLGPAYDPKGERQTLDLRHTDLRGAELEGAKLQGALFWEARLEDVHFRGAHLEEADLREARLAGSHLQWAHLDHANLEGADLNGADLTKASLIYANLSKADLRQAVGLTQVQVDSAYCDESTKLSPSLRPSGKKKPPEAQTLHSRPRSN